MTPSFRVAMNLPSYPPHFPRAPASNPKATAANSTRRKALFTAPKAGVVMRINRKLAPQRAASSSRRPQSITRMIDSL